MSTSARVSYRFPLSSSMVLIIQMGDITKWSINHSTVAIVNPTNESMLGGGKVDKDIHEVAGKNLRRTCRCVPEVRPGVRCPKGEARITPGFSLPVSHVIHTVGPIFGVDSYPATSLASAYRNSLNIAKKNNIRYIAFPAISCDNNKDHCNEAATIAISIIKEFINDFKEVHFVLFEPNVYDIWYNKAATVSSNRDGGGVRRFPLSSSNILIIQKGDITQWSINGSTDAIVNPTNKTMLGGVGVDGAIHTAAGENLQRTCRCVPEVELRPGVRCPTGEARITPGFLLPASHVIHTVGPIYERSNSAAFLASAYRNSLMVAKKNNIKYIAFPAISCGTNGYPYDKAATIAISIIKEFKNDFKEIHFVHTESKIYKIWSEKSKELLKD